MKRSNFSIGLVFLELRSRECFPITALFDCFDLVLLYSRILFVGSSLSYLYVKLEDIYVYIYIFLFLSIPQTNPPKSCVNNTNDAGLYATFFFLFLVRCRFRSNANCMLSFASLNTSRSNKFKSEKKNHTSFKVPRKCWLTRILDYSKRQYLFGSTCIGIKCLILRDISTAMTKIREHMDNWNEMLDRNDGCTYLHR